MKIENKEISEACELFKILGGGACRTLVKILDNNLDKYLLPYLERLEFKKIEKLTIIYGFVKKKYLKI